MGPVEGLFEIQSLPDIHINSPASAPYYFGINLPALIAFVFTAARFIFGRARILARHGDTRAPRTNHAHSLQRIPKPDGAAPGITQR